MDGNDLVTHDGAGIVTMANGDLDRNGSQFMIILTDMKQLLDGSHCG